MCCILTKHEKEEMLNFIFLNMMQKKWEERKMEPSGMKRKEKRECDEIAKI